MGEIESLRIETIFGPLHTELESKERFLEMEEIGSLRPIDIKHYRYVEIWEKIEKEYRKLQIPRNLRNAIEKFYENYGEFLEDLTDFVVWVQELSHEKMGKFFTVSFLNDLIGIVVKSLFLETKKDFRLIILDSFSKLGEDVTQDQLKEFSMLLPRIKSYGLFSPQISDITDLGKRRDGLLAQVRPIIEHIGEIIEKDKIFDLEDLDRRRSEGGMSDKKPEAIPFEYDVFICHASEDKESFVRELAKKLSDKGLRVWYDEFTLLLGDSLRRKIDFGLSKSRYGVVVLSKNFFAKEWPQKELDGLVAREVDGEKVILPIWHGVTKEEVKSFSPTLAGRLAVSSDKGLDYVINEILRVFVHVIEKPSESEFFPEESGLINRISKLINIMTKKPSESEIQNGKPVLRVMQVFLFWVILSPFLLRCDWTSINIILIPFFSLAVLAIRPISPRIAINVVLFLHIVNLLVLLLTSAVCGIYQINMPLPSEILFPPLMFVNALAAVVICQLRLKQ